MNRFTKLLLVVLGVACLGLLVSRLKGDVDEVEARRMAEDMFKKICLTSKWDAAEFEGPVVTARADFPYEFEWKRKPGVPGQGVLIMVDRSGAMNVSSP